ncbi:MAG: ferritin [Bacteroidetes bacterium]|nr:MAG: ferritin [Bacteroidota bacterium]
MAKTVDMRLKTSLLEDTVKKLNKQIQMEGVSSFYYLGMASWAEIHGYKHAAQFLFDHAAEENLHMMKIMKYVNDAGGHAHAPEIKNIRNEFASLREVFETILEHEVAVSKAINNLVDYCFTAKDFGTFQFLQWFVGEQREEEAVSRQMLDFFDLIGEEGQGLYLIDLEIGKFAAQINAAAQTEAK